MSNGTWDVVDSPYEYKLTGYKWMFNKKLKTNGTTKKYRVRILSKGYNQKQGKDYLGTYSPVAHLIGIHLMDCSKWSKGNSV